MTYFDLRFPAVVMTAFPVGQPPIRRHCCMMVGPPARWIAPSTPPPPASLLFAALTIASVDFLVMSPTTRTRVELFIVYSIGCSSQHIFYNGCCSFNVV